MQFHSRQYETITNANTIAQWVDAFNNNALSGSDLQFMIGEATFTSVLYTGLETVGNGTNAYKIEMWKNIAPDFKAVFPDDLVIDNWYVYFRPIGRFILVSNLHVDLTDYSHYDNNEFVKGDLYHFFLNYELGFRISHSPIPKEGEARLFRFVATESSFSQLIATFPRYFYAGNNTDYESLTGLDVEPASVNSIGLCEGWVDYDGISFANHPVPDRKNYQTTLADQIRILDGGYLYEVHDIVPTNIVGINAEVTQISVKYDSSLKWSNTKQYYKNDIVHYIDDNVDVGVYKAKLDNKGSRPHSENENWEFIDRVGAIKAAEKTDKPVNFKGKEAQLKIDDIAQAWNLL